MSHCQAALLLDRGALRVTGADAAKFLQGIITSDLDKTEDGGAVHAALLTPQGKILFDFFVVADDGGFLIEAAKDTLPELSTRLGFYRLRAVVEIAEVPDLQVAAVWDGTADLPEGATSFADPRLAALGTRILLPKGSTIGGCDDGIDGGDGGGGGDIVEDDCGDCLYSVDDGNGDDDEGGQRGCNDENDAGDDKYDYGGGVDEREG